MDKEKMNMKELSENELDKVSGGTYYDAKCVACGQPIGGGGVYCDIRWAIDKVNRYNLEGCPHCGAQPGSVDGPLFELISFEHF